MNPGTVRAAAAVAAQFSSNELLDYGNIILNGYLTVEPNAANKKAWQYKETTTAPVDLPSVTTVRPAIKGWTTNYMEYYTRLQPNGYGVNPGDPAGFSFSVHSYASARGSIDTFNPVAPGSGYNPGTYDNIPLVGGTGSLATINFTVDATGQVVLSTLSLNTSGFDYTVGDGLSLALGSGLPGSGCYIVVTAINATTPNGEARYSQSPRRFNQNQVEPNVPPNMNQAAIPYSFTYPASDNFLAPPIDILAPPSI